MGVQEGVGAGDRAVAGPARGRGGAGTVPETNPGRGRPQTVTARRAARQLECVVWWSGEKLFGCRRIWCSFLKQGCYYILGKCILLVLELASVVTKQCVDCRQVVGRRELLINLRIL